MVLRIYNLETANLAVRLYYKHIRELKEIGELSSYITDDMMLQVEAYRAGVYLVGLKGDPPEFLIPFLPIRK